MDPITRPKLDFCVQVRSSRSGSRVNPYSCTPLILLLLLSHVVLAHISYHSFMAIEHMQWNAEIEISNFRVFDFRFRCCTVALHTAAKHMQQKHMASPYKNRKFRFHIFRFPISHMQRNKENRIFLFNVALLLSMRQQSKCSGTRGLSLWKLKFVISYFLISNFIVALSFPI